MPFRIMRMVNHHNEEKNYDVNQCVISRLEEYHNWKHMPSISQLWCCLKTKCSTLNQNLFLFYQQIVLTF